MIKENLKKTLTSLNSKTINLREHVFCLFFY